MHHIGATLLMVFGTTIGSYLYLLPPIDEESTLAEVTRISAAPDRTPRPTLIAAHTPTLPVAETTVTKTAHPWTAVVTENPLASMPMKSAKPGDATTRFELTRDIQRELKRAGCYGGEIHGYWSAATKRALLVFMERVNASLPLDEPDYVLLATVEGNKNASCSDDCTATETRNDAGRCVPRAVHAQATRARSKAQATTETRLAQADLASEQAQPRRIAVETAIPPQGKSAVAAAKRENGGRTKVAATAPGDELPWLTNSAKDPAKTAASPKVIRPSGMMAMGGPLENAIPRDTPELLPWQSAGLDPEAADNPAPSSAKADRTPSRAKPARAKKAAKKQKRESYYASYDPPKYKRARNARKSVRALMTQSLSGIY